MIEQDLSWPGPDVEPDPDWCMLIDDSPEGPEEYWNVWLDPVASLKEAMQSAFGVAGASFRAAIEESYSGSRSYTEHHWHGMSPSISVHDEHHSHAFYSAKAPHTYTTEDAKKLMDSFLAEEKERRKAELVARKEEQQKHPRNGPRHGPQFKGGKRQW